MQSKGAAMNSIATIETALFWQRHVRDNARNPAQKARAIAAIARLEAQLIDALLLERNA